MRPPGFAASIASWIGCARPFGFRVRVGGVTYIGAVPPTVTVTVSTDLRPLAPLIASSYEPGPMLPGNWAMMDPSPQLQVPQVVFSVATTAPDLMSVNCTVPRVALKP